MASSDQTTFGASIVPAEQRSSYRATPAVHTFDSPTLTPAASHDDMKASIDTNRNGSSLPFNQQQPIQPQPAYSHHPSRTSFTTEKDLEAGTALVPDEENPFRSKVSVDCSKECSKWPSKQTLLQVKEEEKKAKRDQKFCGGCGPVIELWGRLTPKQKLLAKILIALFVVGVAVAIGVGISVAVNGPVYSAPGHTQQIPDSDKR